LKSLLDTNVCITYMRGKDPVLLQRFGQHQPADIALCSVVLAELRYGAECSADPPMEHARIDTFVAPYVSLPFDDAAARLFGEIRRALASAGKQIGPYDTMIAAIALAHGLILVTHNTSKFGRVPGCSWRTGRFRSRFTG
jgi:tRNA(fMet)-specific endonuclease VapC